MLILFSSSAEPWWKHNLPAPNCTRVVVVEACRLAVYYAPDVAPPGVETGRWDAPRTIEPLLSLGEVKDGSEV